MANELKKHSVTKDTPNNIMFGAGIVVEGLKWETNKWTFTKTHGATNGGSKLEIQQTLKDLELDGVTVKTKGLTVKTGETAKLTTNLVELTKENLKRLSLGEIVSSVAVTGYDEIVSKDQIQEDDYVENLGFIGYDLSGEPIIVKFDYAICTSGLSFDSKNDDQTTVNAEYECVASNEAESLNKLPWHIYRKTKEV